jgi:hypothetical protein
MHGRRNQETCRNLVCVLFDSVVIEDDEMQRLGPHGLAARPRLLQG